MNISRGSLAAALAAVTIAVTATPAMADSVHPGTFSGEGFDACTAPASAKMRAWDSSPYRALGIYFGGTNRACAQPALTAAWVSEQTAAGWHLIPIYLGRQASCTLSTKPNKIDDTQAYAQGRADANDAVAQARAIGLAPDSTLIYDMEAYAGNDPECSEGVVQFLGGWSARLHDLGYLSGFYSSMSSGVRDVVAAYNRQGYVRPDYVDFARWDNISTVTDPGIPSAYWSPQRRIKQWRGDHIETHGGVAINIDNDRLDVAPAPRTPHGDFTGNGWSDLLIRSGEQLQIHSSNGGVLDTSQSLTFGASWDTMNAIIRIGDWDKDGREDVVARQASTGRLLFYPGLRNALGVSKQIGTSWNSMRELTAIGDFDSDGFPDLLAASTADNSLYLYPGRDGVVSGPRVKITGGGWDTMSELAGVGDFDSDGFNDLIARHTASGVLYLYPGAAGGFGTRREIGSSWQNMRDLVGAGDINRDGFQDLVSIDASGAVWRYEGDGSALPRRFRMATGFGSRTPAF
ncbi:glycoside hydrolase domain-containing protein [Actinoplanes sp. NBRC 103695]|uniref:glycoside hydrolase domain-containing protein n=1 Tax=Actinoplanes sp. NBRC 103695 TaxID=3032202 RepID=UPI00255713A8|nr:glycoside hydrolase domain-containing protein [Actinoplanes sp. NBRC 103695]